MLERKFPSRLVLATIVGYFKQLADVQRHAQPQLKKLPDGLRRVTGLTARVQGHKFLFP